MKNTLMAKCVIALMSLWPALAHSADEAKPVPDPALDIKPAEKQSAAQVVLAGGCFWCTEAVFEKVPGVTDVVSGYSGGTKEDADYKKVSSGQTGHAEVVQITYDPTKVSYGKILKIFFTIAHDPTQLNKQGPDTGTQYRSAIFFADDEQKKVAEAYIKQLTEAKVFESPIVTTLEKLEEFYPAEDYHQDYTTRKPTDPYVIKNVPPKIVKLRKELKKKPAE